MTMTNKKLKIGIVCFSFLGGSGVVATELGKLLAENGHQIHFIAHDIPFRLDISSTNIFYHAIKINNYHTFRYPLYDLVLANKIAQVAKMEQLNILHVHYAIPHAICAILARQIVGDHLKIVTTLHGTDITMLAHDETLKDLVKLSIDQSDAVTAVSKYLIQEAQILLKTTCDIDLTYNFYNEHIFYPKDTDDLRKSLGIEEDQVLTHISNFRPVKRVSDVIDIFLLVNKEVPSTRLIFVGDGPDISEVQRRVHELKLYQRVHFLGKQADVSHIMSLTNVLLLPSEQESFGLVALEAMACGVPTVGSNVGGVPELVIHGDTGFLAPIGDTKTMAEYTKRLLTDKSLSDQMMHQCLKRARANFTGIHIRSNYEQIYYRVLNSKLSEG
ncbi:unnamed protein product [Adineta ricciae]|uniref:N-acetyl-alpha-D-glucosaminyl L-malate synthase BshA n=1 Tax=Adineta ricciae TaxID=249248 RepID=A0A815PYK1_ADIRI|nr:unnamed protein product [Adineta ricciae]